MISVVVTVVPT